MIRDPSDGSVREHTKPTKNELANQSKQVLSADISGLQASSSRSDYLARLNRSREWLARYRTNPEKTSREMGETGE